MQFKIEVFARGKKIKEFSFTDETTSLVVARRKPGYPDPEVDVSEIEGGKFVTRGIHVELSIEKDALSAVDPGSTNGTFLNGKEMKQGKSYSLQFGDLLRLGTELEIKIVPLS